MNTDAFFPTKHTRHMKEDSNSSDRWGTLRIGQKPRLSVLPIRAFRVFRVFRGPRNGFLGFVVMVCLAMATPLRAEEKKAWSPQSPAWSQIEAALGSVSLDGTLRLSYPLAESDVLQALGIHCALVHAIEQDAGGQARTVWRFAGLQSYLVPEGRDKLRWQPPGGAIVHFERAKIGRALAEAGSPRWLIRASAAGDCEIRALDGRAWRFAQGVLVAAEHPALGEIRFVTRGGLIREILRTDVTGDAALLLRVEYDSNAQVVHLAVGPTNQDSFVWNEAGQLVTWRRADSTEAKFAYRDGLLEEVAISGQLAQRFAWAENPGWQRGDSKWPAPVHLASDGRNDYKCDLTSKGLVIRAREVAFARDIHAQKDTTVGSALRRAEAGNRGINPLLQPETSHRLFGLGKETVTVFNPVRSRLEQRCGNETRVVWFRKNSAGRGALQRIENGAGEVLEDYRYDARGQLVAITRKSEPERVLTYDEAGRLMALDEVTP
jgi:YD repeat-containing protein